VLGNDTETDDVSPEQTQIMDHMNIKVIWARARIEIDMLDTYRSRSTENEHPFGSEVLVQLIDGLHAPGENNPSFRRVINQMIIRINAKTTHLQVFTQ
jgi:hypothetical protein